MQIDSIFRYPVKELMVHFGHGDCGIHAEAINGAPIAPGDTVRLLP